MLDCLQQIRNQTTRVVFAGLSLHACASPVDHQLGRGSPAEARAAGSFSAVAGAAARASTGGAAGATVASRPGSTLVHDGRPAAGSEEGRPRCAAISRQVENKRKPADIIFAVDTSPSMSDEIGFVRERLNVFSQQIVASGIDARIILISRTQEYGNDGVCVAAPLGSGSCPEDSKAPGYLHVPVRVGSHDALDTIIETYPMWRSSLRADARKSIVVVTDDDAFGRTNEAAAAFQQSVAALDPGQFDSWTFSGIFCFSDCPDAAGIGTVYQGLVLQTQGVAGDLCTQNFDPVFDALAEAVIEGSRLECDWSIPAPPAGQTFDRQQVNVQYATKGAAPVNLLRVSDAASCGTRTGWHYDSESDPRRIVVCPATCDMLQVDTMAQFDVLFGCESMLSPF